MLRMDAKPKTNSAQNFNLKLLKKNLLIFISSLINSQPKLMQDWRLWLLSVTGKKDSNTEK